MDVLHSHIVYILHVRFTVLIHWVFVVLYAYTALDTGMVYCSHALYNVHPAGMVDCTHALCTCFRYGILYKCAVYI
jgi:hypothetical protein